MKTDNQLTEASHCETIQVSLSDKLDASQPHSTLEIEHLSNCSECTDFMNFLKNDNFLNIASTPMNSENDLTDSIMQRLHASDKVISPKPTQWRKIISMGSLAAAAAVMISITLNQQQPISDDSSNTATITDTSASVATLDEEILKQDLHQKYQAISAVAGEKWSNVSANIINAKDYLSEKTEMLSDKLLFRKDGAPQSMNEHVNTSKV